MEGGYKKCRNIEISKYMCIYIHMYMCIYFSALLSFPFSSSYCKIVMLHTLVFRFSLKDEVSNAPVYMPFFLLSTSLPLYVNWFWYGYHCVPDEKIPICICIKRFFF
jgi:hypothetical protein